MTLPVLFLSHGSPMRVLENSPAARFLSELGNTLPRPNAIVVISPHWETDELYFSEQPVLDTLYDFYGFPPALSQILYPAKSPAELHQQLLNCAANASLPLLQRLTGKNRGLDHGAWSLLHLMYPQYDIPVVGLSLPMRASIEQLYQLGQQLAPLREQGVLIIASGMSTHNLSLLKRSGAEGELPEPWAQDFINWLKPRVADNAISELVNYRQLAPAAVQAHPRDEHLRPLFIAMGAGANGGLNKPQLIHDSWELKNGSNASWMWP